MQNNIMKNSEEISEFYFTLIQTGYGRVLSDTPSVLRATGTGLGRDLSPQRVLKRCI
jgi:hypothetical protein